MRLKEEDKIEKQNEKSIHKVACAKREAQNKAKNFRGQTAIEYVMMISASVLGATYGFPRNPGIHPPSLKRLRAQTAIEYVMMISATVVFITLVAYFVKTRVIAP